MSIFHRTTTCFQPSFPKFEATHRIHSITYQERVTIALAPSPSQNRQLLDSFEPQEALNSTKVQCSVSIIF
ncbi:hypothetical protein L1887_25555 [Cichorium endivia]|nr:hypothetical protein L1887_25555 [Cichorium endivia]